MSIKEETLDKIYLVQELQCHPYEKGNNALFYKTIGFVTDHGEVEKIRKDGGILKKNWCWPMNEDMPKYRYLIIERIKEE